MPRLEATADGAAIFVVVEGADAALHVVEQALLLGLELLHALLELPLLRCLRPAPYRLRIGLRLLRIAVTQVQLRRVRGSGAEDDCSDGAYEPRVELGVGARNHAHDVVGQQESH